MKYTHRQTKANRRKLSDALRSGQYNKCEHVLTNETMTAFCCLGVACDISGLGKWNKHGGYVPHGTKEDYYINLPPEVQDWLGLKDPDGRFIKTGHGGTSLRSLNDRGVPFEEIADIIDSNPKQLAEYH